MHPSSDARPLVYHGNHQALPTAQLRRAGQLALYIDRADLIELFKMMKGLSSTPWSHFQKGRRHFNQRAHLETGEEALSLRFTFVLLFPEGRQ